MATLKDIKRRIESIKKTQQITKAMKMVAASKLRKSQRQLQQTRPYARELSYALQLMASRNSIPDTPLFQQRSDERRLYVAVSADKGLCGSFNANVFRQVEMEYENNKNRELHLVVLGRKGCEHFRRQDYEMSGHCMDFFNQLDYNEAKKIADYLLKLYKKNYTDRIYMIYTTFISSLQQKVVVEPFLPISPPQHKDESESEYPPTAMLFQPHPKTIFDKLAPMSLNYGMYRILLESFTAEQGARMTAMETASDNAQDMIRDLQLYYNKQRQATITKQLTEVVSSAEALRG